MVTPLRQGHGWIYATTAPPSAFNLLNLLYYVSFTYNVQTSHQDKQKPNFAFTCLDRLNTFLKKEYFTGNIYLFFY